MLKGEGRNLKRKTLLAVVFVFLLFANILLVYADSISGPGDYATYHLGTNFRKSGGLWVIDLINIDYSGLTDLGGSGKEAFQFMIHEWDGGLADWALIGIQVHKENGAYAFQLFYDVSPHGPWQVVRSHGIPDGTHNTWPFSTTFDMRITLRYDGVKFIVLAYFRVLGETAWTLFYDCQVSGPAEITVPNGLLDNADIQVQIDGQSDGTVTFDPPTLTRPPPVGGVWTPINKFELLAPWIGLASLITAATMSIVYVKHRKKKQT